MQRLLLGVSIFVASGGCLSSLGLDDYTFTGGPDAGSSAGNGGSLGNSGGTAGSGPGAAGDAGSPGTGGNSGSAGSSNDEPDAAAGAAGDTGSPEDAGPDAPAPIECSPGDRCVPEVPLGWDGPLAVSAGGSVACPSAYPTSNGEVNADLDVGSANCGCGCSLSSVSCRLLSTTGEFFEPSTTCASPPVEPDCLTAVVDASCTPIPSSNIQPNDWNTTELTCGGAASTGVCDTGTCYPSTTGFGRLCIATAGDVACPAGFPDRSLYFQDFADTRECSTCSCSPQGQGCAIELDVCSVGFFQVTLAEGEEQCTDDGDGISVLSNAVTANGICATTGGTLQGTATPTDPVTICCLD